MMKKAILGRKIGMTQVFAADGTMKPVTVIEAGPCTVVQKKTAEKDGYDAVQVSFGDIREKLVNKPKKGHFAKANVKPQRYVKELKVENAAQLEVGAVLSVEAFEAGERIDVCAISKGKGFAGVIKRWNQARSRMSHGGGPVHRSAGSMGANSSPSRVFKHKHLAGHLGCERVTVQNLEIIRVDKERNLLLIKGAVPGPKGGLVTAYDSIKGSKK